MYSYSEVTQNPRENLRSRETRLTSTCHAQLDVGGSELYHVQRFTEWADARGVGGVGCAGPHTDRIACRCGLVPKARSLESFLSSNLVAYPGGCSGARVLEHPLQPSYTCIKLSTSLLDAACTGRLTFSILGDAQAWKVCERARARRRAYDVDVRRPGFPRRSEGVAKKYL